MKTPLLVALTLLSLPARPAHSSAERAVAEARGAFLAPQDMPKLVLCQDSEATLPVKELSYDSLAALFADIKGKIPTEKQLTGSFLSAHFDNRSAEMETRIHIGGRVKDDAKGGPLAGGFKHITLVPSNWCPSRGLQSFKEEMTKLVNESAHRYSIIDFQESGAVYTVRLNRKYRYELRMSGKYVIYQITVIDEDPKAVNAIQYGYLYETAPTP